MRTITRFYDQLPGIVAQRGNSLGSKVQRRWDSFHAECRAAFEDTSSALKGYKFETVAKLKRDGLANLGITACSELISASEDLFDGLEASGPGVKLPREKCGEMAPLVMDVFQQITPVVEAFYGSHFQPYWISFEENNPAQVRPETSFGWHIDDNPAQLMKIFIYLNDVREDNGAFRAFTYDASRKILAAGFRSWSAKSRVGSQTMVEEYLSRHPGDLMVLEGEAGTALMFDNNLVHKGTPPKRGRRRLCQIEIFPSMAPISLTQVQRALTAKMHRDYPLDPHINDIAGSR